jgi:hypothetical protein
MVCGAGRARDRTQEAEIGHLLERSAVRRSPRPALLASAVPVVRPALGYLPPGLIETVRFDGTMRRRFISQAAAAARSSTASRLSNWDIRTP